jgi:hypothetical protein
VSVDLKTIGGLGIAVPRRPHELILWTDSGDLSALMRTNSFKEGWCDVAMQLDVVQFLPASPHQFAFRVAAGLTNKLKDSATC